MGVREFIHRYRRVVAPVVVVGLVVSVAYAVYQWRSAPADPLAGSGKAFYSVDDGTTYFVAGSEQIPPFLHEGREAVQALVYTDDGGKTTFVGYLMRFTPRGVELMRAMRQPAGDRPRALPGLDPGLQANTEVKRPGAGAWVKLSDIAAAGEVMSVKSRTDPSRLADPVEP